jgi:hypothetical protein
MCRYSNRSSLLADVHTDSSVAQSPGRREASGDISIKFRSGCVHVSAVLCGHLTPSDSPSRCVSVVISSLFFLFS